MEIDSYMNFLYDETDGINPSKLVTGQNFRTNELAVAVVQLRKKDS